MKYFSFLSLCFVLFLGANVYGQNQSFQTTQGDKAFNRFDYKLAIEYYKVALKNKHSDSLYLCKRTAEAYKMMNDPNNAKTWYAAAISRPGADPKLNLELAEMLKQNLDYDGARQYAKTYNALVPGDQAGIDFLKSLDKVEVLSKDDPRYQVEIMPFNSRYSDFGPAWFGKDSLFFTSNRRHPYGKETDEWSYHDFYKIYLINSSNLAKVDVLPAKRKLNKRFHDGPVAFDAAHQQLIFTRSNRTTHAVTAQDKRTVHLELYSIKYPILKKAKVKSLSFNNKDISNAHPALSANGDTLYFASDRSGGYGGTDIYMAVRNGDDWSAPVNLGPGVNGPGDEKFPYITAAGQLYFASNSYGGLGGLDVFSSQVKANNWTKPLNIGAPVNSNRDDFGYIISEDETHGYFASNRNGGVGDDDIYGFTLAPKIIKPLIVYVYDADTKDPLNRVAVMVNIPGQSDYSMPASGADGYTKANITSDSPSKLTASLEGYRDGSLTADISNHDSIIRIPLTRSTLKLMVTVLDKFSNEPIRDVNIVLSAKNNQTITTYATGFDGSFTETLNMGDGYNISSPDFEMIIDEIKPTERPNVNGIIHRTYFVGSEARIIHVPIISNCLKANSLVTITNDSTHESFVAKVEADGKLRLALKPNNKYTMTFNGMKHPFSTSHLSPGDAINLACKFGVGETWVLKNLYYDLNKWNIRPDAAKVLDKLVIIMQKNPTLEVELSSHTDCRQTVKYNQTLSNRRAISAVEYITHHRVNPSRIVAKGYGETRLVNNCACEPTNVSSCSNEEHQANRRTEVTVLKY